LLSLDEYSCCNLQTGQHYRQEIDKREKQEEKSKQMLAQLVKDFHSLDALRSKSKSTDKKSLTCLSKSTKICLLFATDIER
jgi:hypothetical protein